MAAKKCATITVNAMPLLRMLQPFSIVKEALTHDDVMRIYNLVEAVNLERSIDGFAMRLPDKAQDELDQIFEMAKRRKEKRVWFYGSSG